MRWLAILPGSFLLGGAAGYAGAATIARRLTYRTRTRRL